MMKKEVTIKFVNGVEASPIALLVQTANRFSSSIYIESGDKKSKCEEHYGYDDTWSGQWRGSYRDRKRKDESEAMDGVENI